jgi:NAD(P)-dependent dehydrogenase (short-subunit alcohol dehydrogenase family)
MSHRGKTALIIGAGDYIGSAIARRFAREGYIVHAGRRNGEKLQPLVEEIALEGGICRAKTLDARQEQGIADFFAEAEAEAPIEVVVFNVGGNVYYPILETTERVFRKVWELSCYSGFLAGREAARYMLPREQGSIFFTGATARVRGSNGYSAFAAAKHGLRGHAQAMARELGPKNIHVAHLIIDAAVDTTWVRERIRGAKGDDAVNNLPPDGLMNPDSIASTYWYLHTQPRDAWTFELDVRPYIEKW